ncbi:hypothetical protein Leryth_017084, partial [Lithospermum erythrorhizon]
MRLCAESQRRSSHGKMRSNWFKDGVRAAHTWCEDGFESIQIAFS